MAEACSFGRPPFASLWRFGFRALAPAGQRSRLTILIFHRVLREFDPLRPDEPTAEEFQRQLTWVKNWFNVLPLPAAVQAMKDDGLPERPLAVTFDDGYADNHDIALPILLNVGVPATFFVATGYLDGGRMFNDTVIEAVRRAPGTELDLSDLGLGVLPIMDDSSKRAAIDFLLNRVKYLPQNEREERVCQIADRCGGQLPNDLMMNSEQIAALREAGMEIGAHTETHPILRQIGPAAARQEIIRGRQRLQEITGRGVGLFAYPNGRPGRDYGSEHVSLVRELGFDAAVCTQRGVAQRGTDRYQLPRFTPWDRRGWRYGLRLMSTLVKQVPAGASP